MSFAKRAATTLVASAAIAGCHSAGPYGHAPDYAALDDESKALVGAREFDPITFDRQREDWHKAAVSLFGVVETRAPGQGGAAMLKLSVRRLEPRNVCRDPRDEDSCLVTVSDKDYGVVYALVALHGDDDTGPRAVGAKSLLRVVGKFGQDVSPTDGAPVLHAGFYRHWPTTYYATKRSDVSR